MERTLSITSPAGHGEESFKWIDCKEGEIREENAEVVEVISWIFEDVSCLSDDKKLSSLLENVDRSSYESVSDLCDRYNSVIESKIEEWKRFGVKPDFMNAKACPGQIQFILYQCYNRAVLEPDKLNQYQPFSPQVYGETSFELITEMINRVEIKSDESFIDLGSGVGQVVLQVAACTDAKFCCGIEKADYPAACSARMGEQFNRWMSFYGKSYRPYSLDRGDFLATEFHERITTAGVLFANNFAFGPELDHQLKQRFANLREGARIISSKAFCPLNFRITDRNLSDIGSIMHVRCLNPIQDAVSWTDKPFSYYIHTIDRSLLERYFLRLKNPKLKDELELVRRDRKGRIISDQALKDRVQATVTSRSSDPTSWSESSDSSRSNGLRSCRSRSAGPTGVMRKHPPRNGQQSRNRHTLKKHSRARRSFTDLVGQRHHSNRSSVELRIHRPTRQSTAKSIEHLDDSVGYRLASLTLTPNTCLEETQSVSNVTNFQEGVACHSGGTTPTGSTSISSTGFSIDDPGSGLVQLNTDDALVGSREDSPLGVTNAIHVSGDSSGSQLNWASYSSSTVKSSNEVLDNTIVAHTPSVSDGHDVVKATQPTLEVVRSSAFADHTISSGCIENQQEPGNKLNIHETSSEVDMEDTSVARRRTMRKCRQSVATTLTATKPLNSTLSRCVTLRHKATCNSKKLIKSHGSMRSRNSQKTTDTKNAVHSQSHLDLLHDETVAQIERVRNNRLAFGCNDPDLASFTCHYQPRYMNLANGTQEDWDPTVDHAEEVVPLALTQYLELCKHVFMEHFTRFRSPSYASAVHNQLVTERARHAQLLDRVRDLNESIVRLHSKGSALLQDFSQRLGILLSTPSAFFAQARKLIKHHHVLECKIAEYRQQVSELSTANQTLVRRHQLEANRLLITALRSKSSSSKVGGHRHNHQNTLPQPDTKLQPSTHQHLQSLINQHKRDHPINVSSSVRQFPPMDSYIPPPPPLTKVCSKPALSTRYPNLLPKPYPSPCTAPPPALTCSRLSPSKFSIKTELFLETPSTTPERRPALLEPIPPPPPLLPMVHHQSMRLPIRSIPHTSLCTTTVTSISSPPTAVKSVHESIQDLINTEVARQSAVGSVYNHKENKSNNLTITNTSHFALPPRKRPRDTVTQSSQMLPLDSVVIKTPRSGSPNMLQTINLSPPTLSPVGQMSTLDDPSFEMSDKSLLSADTSLHSDSQPPDLPPWSNSCLIPPPPCLAASSDNHLYKPSSLRQLSPCCSTPITCGSYPPVIIPTSHSPSSPETSPSIPVLLVPTYQS